MAILKTRQATTWSQEDIEVSERTIASLRKQLSGLHLELNTVSSEYDQALLRINELEAERFAMVRDKDGEQAAHIVEDLSTREQYYREQAENWAQSNRILEEEMQTAGSVQRLLVPDAPPKDIPGIQLATSYISASKTSGDLFGFQHFPDSCELCFFVADATGHGLPAALITAGVTGACQTLRILSGTSSDIEETVMQRRLDPKGFKEALEDFSRPSMLLAILDSVVASMAKKRFAMTLLACSYDYQTRLLKYSNAGHCFPILVRNGSAQILSGSEVQLGVSDEFARRRSLSEVKLQYGDLLFLYTDGITEACNSRGHAVGMRRLSEWLINLSKQPADVIREGIQNQFSRFTGEADLEDDVTFLVVKCESE